MAKVQAISHAPAPDAPANAAEGALATSHSHPDAPRGISHAFPPPTPTRQSTPSPSVIPDSDRESIPRAGGHSLPVGATGRSPSRGVRVPLLNPLTIKPCLKHNSIKTP